MDTYSYGWVVDYANIRCGENTFTIDQHYVHVNIKKTHLIIIQLKIAILLWGHRARIMKQSQNEFSQAKKNAVMRSYRGTVIV